jgi:hypothetical protein
MNGFQYLVGALLVLLVVITLRAGVRGGIRKRIASFWILVWISAGVATIWPRSTVLVARSLGIGRGADLILYCSVFAMLIGFFYIYVRFRRLDRALTLLVRQLAIENALTPGAGPVPGEPKPSAASRGAHDAS